MDFNGELDGGAWFPWFKPLTNVGGYAEEGVDRSRDKRALRTTPTLELDCKKSPLGQILWPFTVQGENIVNPPPPTHTFILILWEANKAFCRTNCAVLVGNPYTNSSEVK